MWEFSGKKSNMDFLMNGPRLQASLLEGFENVGGVDLYGNPFRSTNPTSWNSTYEGKWSCYSEIVLQDMWDGRQSVNKYGYYGANLNGYEYHAKARFALRSDQDPDVYLIFSYFSLGPEVNLAEVAYFNIAKSSTAPETAYYDTARTFTVTLNTDDWWTFRMDGSARTATNGPANLDRTSTGIYSASIANTLPTRERQPYVGNANNGTYGTVDNPGTGYVSVAVTGNQAVYRYEFPAKAYLLRTTGAGSTSGTAFSHFPLNLNGRKYGGPYDLLFQPNDASSGVYKVYSPQKGCLALKSYINGEVPIFNE